MSRATAAERAKVENWYEAMVAASKELTPEDEIELARWEEERLARPRASGLATSDWPGWGRYLDLDRLWPWERPSPFGRLAAALDVPESVLHRIADEGLTDFLLLDLQAFSAKNLGQAAQHETSRSNAPRAPRPKSFVVYRLLGDNDRVLYIGSTRNWRARERAHRRRLGALIVRTTTEEYDDEESMLEAEAAAIRDERPPLNSAGI